MTLTSIPNTSYAKIMPNSLRVHSANCRPEELAPFQQAAREHFLQPLKFDQDTNFLSLLRFIMRGWFRFQFAGLCTVPLSFVFGALLTPGTRGLFLQSRLSAPSSPCRPSYSCPNSRKSLDTCAPTYENHEALTRGKNWQFGRPPPIGT